MDAKSILDQILSSGKELASKSREFAENKLGVPKAGEGRDAAVSNLGKGAAIGGLLALLLGTRTGRSATGKIVKYGSIAAVAAVAYKAYQAWQSSNATAQGAGKPLSDLSADEANGRQLLLLRAMIAAANADGHIDADERTRIESQLKSIDPNAQRLLSAELAQPASIEKLASSVDSPAAAAEVYLLSSLVIDDRNHAEVDYLDRLASALRLSPELVSRLHVEGAAG